MPKVMECFKIVRHCEGKLKFLFHGINKDRTIHHKRWLKAERKWAGEGGTKYWTGIHVLKDFGLCVDYLCRFKTAEDKAIIRCDCKGLRPKESSRGDVFLADWMRYTDIVWVGGADERMIEQQEDEFDVYG